MKRSPSLVLFALLAACVQTRTVSIAVEVDGKPESGPVSAVVEAARPQLTACCPRETRSSTALSFDVDAAGRAKMPFLDHPFPTVACVRDTLGALAFPPGPARVVTVRVVHATAEERAAGDGR